MNSNKLPYMMRNIYNRNVQHWCLRTGRGNTIWEKVT